MVTAKQKLIHWVDKNRDAIKGRHAKVLAAFVALAICALACSACANGAISQADNVVNQDAADGGPLVVVETYGNRGWELVVDPETRVEYLHHREGNGNQGYECLTARLDADGKPILWEGEL